jgi:hypothetical protein
MLAPNDPLLSRIHVNTTWLLNILCTLVATVIILGRLKCGKIVEVLLDSRNMWDVSNSPLVSKVCTKVSRDHISTTSTKLPDHDKMVTLSSP